VISIGGFVWYPVTLMIEPCTWSETCCSKTTLSCDWRLLALHRFIEGLMLNTFNEFEPLNYSGEFMS